MIVELLPAIGSVAVVLFCMEFVKNRLFNPDAHIYNFFDRTAICSLVEQHLRGEKNKRLLIWSLLNFEEWCEQFGR